MESYPLPTILFILAVFSATTQTAHYVKPSSLISCPGQPCLTLDQYNQQTETYFTTGSTFVFLAGNHIINTTVNLTSISEITLRGEKNTQVNIVCLNEFSTLIQNVSHLSIDGLVFLSGNTTIGTVALRIIDSNGVWIHNVGFQGNYSFSKPFSGLHITSSDTITVTSCSFEGNTADNGGAIYVTAESNLTLNASTFIGNNATRHGGAIYASGSNLTLSDNMFSGNTAGNGGAMYVTAESNVTISDNAFTHNRAFGNGGAMYSEDSIVSISGSTKNSSILSSGGYCRTCDMITTIPKSIPYEEVIMELNEALCATHFTNNTATRYGGAMSIYNSTVLFSGSVIMFRYNSAHTNGGAMHIHRKSSIAINSHHLFFTSNKAHYRGGGFHIVYSNFRAEVGNIYFLLNSAENGGGIYFDHASEMLSGKSYFIANRAESSNIKTKSVRGGAIITSGSFNLTGSALLAENTAKYGGAIYTYGNFSISGDVRFINNTAIEGGAIAIVDSKRTSRESRVNAVVFINNTAFSAGGGIWVGEYYRSTSRLYKNPVIIQSAKFTSNTAGSCGSALYTYRVENIYLEDIHAVLNVNSALCITESSVNFCGKTNIFNNSGTLGGGIKITSKNTLLHFKGSTVLYGNKAGLGGAIYSPFGTKLTFSGDTLFSHNTADTNGGAIYSVNTNITFDLNSVLSFKWNTAENGGAMYLTSASFLTFNRIVNISISYNHATKYGGGIYNEDIASAAQCSFKRSEIVKLSELPYCFIRFTYPINNYKKYNSTLMLSQNNSAGRNGSLIHGGLLDRCQVETISSLINIPEYFFKIQKAYREITSQPYQLCFCRKTIHRITCSHLKSIEIFPGQRFDLSLMAFDQTKTSVTTEITVVSATSRLNSDQSSQTLEPECSKLWYNLYSTQDTDQLILYPDGPCRDTGLARAVVNVTFRPCPDGFMKSGENCVCEGILNEYNASCTINDNATISRQAGSSFWVQGWYENGIYQGLIHYKTCPRDYCKRVKVTLPLENPDTQCDLNRSGLLCGECATNHSLMLGSSRCHDCSNTYLALLLPFAAAGIALTVSLIFLRLTVATGMINSIILYSNIVQVNRKLFFPANQINILTIFIAWMNLDLGFETCFFHGLDEYLQTWLQLVFPLYIWIILGSIIFTSRYSITMSKLTGSNPVAVLATLLLMSYTKVLKIIVEVYSSVRLEYPNNETVSVWLKDANVPYLQSKHLLLTVVVTLILIFAFLPYTLLLLLGYKTYRLSGRRYYRLLRRLRPLLESYYGPYETHTRYWTGFLLLVRCTLYIVFSFNSFGGERKSLLAIVIVFMGVTIAPWLSIKIYKRFIVNVIEASIYLNLVILSAATLADVNSPALVYSLVGVTLATLIGIMVYHFHISYITRRAFWQRIKTKVISHFKNKPKETEIIDPTVGTGLSSHDPTKLVTKTHIDLREPLLDD